MWKNVCATRENISIGLLALVTSAIAAHLTASAQHGDAQARVGDTPVGIICGTVYWLGDHTSKGIPVYLFDLKESSPLQKLVRDTQSQLRSLGQSNPKTVDVEIEFFEIVAGNGYKSRFHRDLNRSLLAEGAQQIADPSLIG